MWKSMYQKTHAVPFDINLRKERFLVISIHHPPLQKSKLFQKYLTFMIDSFTCWNDNFLIMGCFNMEPSDFFLPSFCDSCSLLNLIKNNTWSKGIVSCIDIILSNMKNYFETGRVDHHHMIHLTSSFINEEPKFNLPSLMKNQIFQISRFTRLFLTKILKENLATLWEVVSSDSFDELDHIFTTKLNVHAPKRN